VQVGILYGAGNTANAIYEFDKCLGSFIDAIGVAVSAVTSLDPSKLGTVAGCGKQFIWNIIIPSLPWKWFQ
jgi:hypothetical protein